MLRMVPLPRFAGADKDALDQHNVFLVTTGRSRSQNGVASLAYAGGPC